jgi:rhodanese-related sulfurtransferase
LGLGSPLTHHVLLIDLLSLSISQIKTRRNPDCPVCAKAASTTPKAKKEEQVQLEQQEERQDEDQEDNEFELHWSVLRSRSPRELVYVDIRTKGEIEADQSTQGKLKGRQLNECPLESIDVKALQLDKNLTYLFMCQRGKRSATLVRKLRQLGHRNVFSLSEGVASMSPQHSEHAKV